MVRCGALPNRTTFLPRTFSQFSSVFAALGLLVASCSGSGKDRSGRSPADSASTVNVAADAAPVAVVTSDAAAVAKAPEPAEPKPPEPKPEPPKPKGPAIDPATDFTAEAKAFYRIAACGGSAPIPKSVSPELVAANCKVTDAAITTYRKKYIDKVTAFFKDKAPSDLKKVVYPFAGADLVSALSVFRDASEITTLSLEPAGDPRALDRVPPKRLKKLLLKVREFMVKLMRVTHNRTVDLTQVMTWGRLPGHLMFTMIGLRVHGYEPIAMRYFAIKPDGSLEYGKRDDLAKAVAAAEKRYRGRKDRPSHRRLPARVKPFSNVEIHFRLEGKADAPIRVYRHIRADLGNKFLRKDGRVLKHLEAKGKIAAMTKAGSYLLWLSNFTKMRRYLLAKMDWMVSDATGIPPRYSRKAGFEVKAWGSWKRQIKDAMPLPDYLLNEMRRLWRKAPKLGFRFGYPGGTWADHHLMITKRKK